MLPILFYQFNHHIIIQQYNLNINTNQYTICYLPFIQNNQNYTLHILNIFQIKICNTKNIIMNNKQQQISKIESQNKIRIQKYWQYHSKQLSKQKPTHSLHNINNLINANYITDYQWGISSIRNNQDCANNHVYAYDNQPNLSFIGPLVTSAYTGQNNTCNNSRTNQQQVNKNNEIKQESIIQKYEQNEQIPSWQPKLKYVCSIQNHLIQQQKKQYLNANANVNINVDTNQKIKITSIITPCFKTVNSIDIPSMRNIQTKTYIQQVKQDANYNCNVNSNGNSDGGDSVVGTISFSQIANKTNSNNIICANSNVHQGNNIASLSAIKQVQQDSSRNNNIAVNSKNINKAELIVNNNNKVTTMNTYQVVGNQNKYRQANINNPSLSLNRIQQSPYNKNNKYQSYTPCKVNSNQYQTNKKQAQQQTCNIIQINKLLTLSKTKQYPHSIKYSKSEQKQKCQSEPKTINNANINANININVDTKKSGKRVGLKLSRAQNKNFHNFQSHQNQKLEKVKRFDKLIDLYDGILDRSQKWGQSDVKIIQSRRGRKVKQFKQQQGSCIYCIAKNEQNKNFCQRCLHPFRRETSCEKVQQSTSHVKGRNTEKLVAHDLHPKQKQTKSSTLQHSRTLMRSNQLSRPPITAANINNNPAYAQPQRKIVNFNNINTINSKNYLLKYPIKPQINNMNNNVSNQKHTRTLSYNSNSFNNKSQFLPTQAGLKYQNIQNYRYRSIDGKALNIMY